MQVRNLLMISLVSLAPLPAPAAAQSWFVSPFVGANFGGSASFGEFPDADDEVERRLDLGATVGWNPNVVGFEVDFGFSPNFFEDTAGDRNFDFGESNVTTLMTNLLISAPPGTGLRPYLSSGLGLIRANIDGGDFFDDLSTNDLGVNIGAGLNGQFTDNVGIRGDIRYFRGLEQRDDDDPLEDDDFADEDFGFERFSFWRGTVGVTFRW
jgi:opacity protein-like surface antigen